MTNQYLSISCLPLPTYVQSGHVVFNPGDRHPNRNNFQFFVMIFMVRGKLYIAEDDQEYVVGPGEMFILQPKHHHYSWKPMDQTTEYYWVHFSVTGCYLQASEPQELHSVIPVPSLHYYTPKMTLFLSKHSHITNMPGICALVKKYFRTALPRMRLAFGRPSNYFWTCCSRSNPQRQVNPRRRFWPLKFSDIYAITLMKKLPTKNSGRCFMSIPTP